ncbi:hypothetical protein DFJ74DRAFT_664714 [Hyaloraphidium curvatum]|nr:hypothetical protein DFJ74DRAFT_664714 [Hyaloraphidium curvatum]
MASWYGHNAAVDVRKFRGSTFAAFRIRRAKWAYRRFLATWLGAFPEAYVSVVSLEGRRGPAWTWTPPSLPMRWADAPPHGSLKLPLPPARARGRPTPGPSPPRTRPSPPFSSGPRRTAHSSPGTPRSTRGSSRRGGGVAPLPRRRRCCAGNCRWPAARSRARQRPPIGTIWRRCVKRGGGQGAGCGWSTSQRAGGSSFPHRSNSPCWTTARSIGAGWKPSRKSTQGW